MTTIGPASGWGCDGGSAKCVGRPCNSGLQDSDVPVQRRPAEVAGTDFDICALVQREQALVQREQLSRQGNPYEPAATLAVVGSDVRFPAQGLQSPRSLAAAGSAIPGQGVNGRASPQQFDARASPQQFASTFPPVHNATMPGGLQLPPPQGAMSAMPAPAVSPAYQDARTQHSGRCMRIGTVFLEVIKTFSWFLQALRLVMGMRYVDIGLLLAFLVVNFVMALIMVYQRFIDQMNIILAAQNRWHAYGCRAMSALPLCLTVVTFPLSLPCLILSDISLKIYGVRSPDTFRFEAADMKIFAHRPLSTALLGMPFSSLVSLCTADEHLVLHPLQTHVRSMQSMYHCLFDFVPSIICDLLIVYLTGHVFFMVSAGYFVCALMFGCSWVSFQTVVSEKERQARRRYYTPVKFYGDVPEMGVPHPAMMARPI